MGTPFSGTITLYGASDMVSLHTASIRISDVKRREAAWLPRASLVRDSDVAREPTLRFSRSQIIRKAKLMPNLFDLQPIVNETDGGYRSGGSYME